MNYPRIPLPLIRRPGGLPPRLARRWHPPTVWAWRWRRRQPGQALVEFLMVVPILLLLLGGLIDVGQLLLANYTVNQAARAAAHQAAIAGGDTTAASETATYVINSGVGTSAERAAVLVACARMPCRRYDPVSVSIVYVDSFWAPIPPLFSGFSVRAEAVRAAERDAQ